MSLFEKKWKNAVLLEGEKEAIILAREENLPDVNPCLGEVYPVDVMLPKSRTLLQALRRSVDFSKMGIYNMVIKRK